MSLGEVLKARVLGPLGMGDTAFWVPAEKRGRLAALYRARPGGGLKDVSSAAIRHPAGARGV